MNRDNRTLAERLREARGKTNLSQGDVARAVEMSQPNYCDLEQGKQLGSSRIVEIADVLRVNPRWLTMGIDDTESIHFSEVEQEIIDIFRSNKKIKKQLLETLVDWRESQS